MEIRYYSYTRPLALIYRINLKVRNWLIYSFLLVFAVYWASNLFLWYPWSYNTSLGMILMLTVSPIAWAYTVYLSLITYPKERIINGSLIIALIFLLTAIILDYMFFAIIRNAFEELYHPTTLYGYGFLFSLPFLVVWLFRKHILTRKKVIKRKFLIKAGFIGILCLSILVLIITFDLNIK